MGRQRGGARLRVVISGLEGEHAQLEEHNWSVIPWRKQERLWLSPHCRREDFGPLFVGDGGVTGAVVGVIVGVVGSPQRRYASNSSMTNFGKPPACSARSQKLDQFSRLRLAHHAVYPQSGLNCGVRGDILAAMTDPRAYAFFGASLLLRRDGESLRLPTLAELREVFGEDHLAQTRLPTEAARHVFGFGEGEAALPEGFRLDGLRVAYHALSRAEFRSAGAALQRFDWYRTHRFCSRCGSTTAIDAKLESMDCSACGQRHFARIAPAVIVLVQRGHEVLLGRSPHFPPGIYSALAGFVEPGESLEECVHREIAEEVGVRIGNLRYFGSQPHPFPHSLMVGFIADWIEGEIRIDPEELEDARWFHCEQLPTLPHPMSIARALIDDFRSRTLQ